MSSHLNINAMLADAPVGQTISWSFSGLKISEAEFGVLAQQLLELENRGIVEIVDTRKESYTGNRYHTAIMFRQLE
jgi:hypothetical protein